MELSTMMRCLILIFSLLLLPINSSVAATTYVVRYGSVRAVLPCNHTTPCTMTYANQNAVAGDTIQLCSEGGNFTGAGWFIEPVASGSIGTGGGTNYYLCDSYITYENYPGESPKIYNTEYGAYLMNRKCIKIRGISFEKQISQWVCIGITSANAADRNYIGPGNTFKNSKVYTGIGIGVSVASCNTTDSSKIAYTVIDGNTFEDTSDDPYAECGKSCSSTSCPFDINCDCPTCPANFMGGSETTHLLAVNNTLGKCAHLGLSFYANGNVNQHFNVYKGNTITNKFHSGLESALLLDGALIDSNTLIDTAIEYDHNPIKESRTNIHGQVAPLVIEQDGDEVIIRRNVIYNSSDGAGAIMLGGGADRRSSYSRFYNNTIYGTSAGFRGLGPSLTPGVAYNVFKNNTVNHNSSDTWGGGQVNLPEGVSQNVEGNTFLYNNFYDPIRVKYENTWYTTIAQLETNKSEFTNNMGVNPSFRSVTSGSQDLRLSTGSSLIDAGTHLTTTSSAKTGSTALDVADSYYFYSRETWETPYHASVLSDYVYIEGASPSEVVQITNVTRGIPGTLTLASPRTWAVGAGVGVAHSPSIKYNGAKPDIGAYEYDQYFGIFYGNALFGVLH